MAGEERFAGAAVTAELLRKYDRPGPRYTSYPTVPVWSGSFGPADYERRLQRAGREARDLPFSLYVHVPFCASLCFYCACNVVVTRRREVVAPYLAHVEREIELVSARIGERRTATQLHLGGGTPTYLAPAELRRLVSALRARFQILPGAEMAIEVDPRVTTRAHLEALSSLGFNRVSLGVQDFSPRVQRAVNRRQSEEETRAAADTARALGFASVNVDLMYGLPEQTEEDFARTLDVVLDLRPDRVALFSYAHLPWLKPAQASFERKGYDLPGAERKFAIFRAAHDRFLSAGYGQIGMDHFALAEDELARARDGGYLFRNFQGYTVRPAPDSLAFGVTGISDVAGCYAQSARQLEEYYRFLDNGSLPVVRGCEVTAEDALRRDVILGLLCNFTLDLGKIEERHRIAFAEHFAAELAQLRDFAADGLVKLSARAIDVTPLGRFFIRNVCMVFDARLPRAGDRPLFSRTV
ncbi:MAG: oxygen-independent coproporphyrinogen III oxidase [Planctomycetes bacterium]|nr:oxygen-independent coproporphyrinogen III oxidase [Planctomycetota bacterium]